MPSPPGERAGAAAALPQRVAPDPQRVARARAPRPACRGVFVIAVCTPLMPGAPGPPALPAADRLVVHPARRRRRARCSSSPGPRRRPGRAPPARAHRGTRRRPAGSPRRCPRRPRPVDRAATTVPGGAITCTGRSAPPFAGIVGSVAARSANATALTVTASTAFTLPGRCGSVPVKSNVTPSPSTVTRRRRSRAGVLLLGTRPGGVEHVGERATRRRGARRSAARIRRSP